MFEINLNIWFYSVAVLTMQQLKCKNHVLGTIRFKTYNIKKKEEKEEFVQNTCD